MIIEQHIREPFNQKLYQFYCWLCEQSGELTSLQATFAIEEIQRIAGYPSTSKHFAFNGEDVSFRELLSLLENIFADDTKELECTIDALFDRYINQVMNKGFYLVRNTSPGKIGCMSSITKRKWQNAWVTIEPGVIKIQKIKGSGKPEKTFDVILDKSWCVKTLYQDNNASYITGLETKSKLFEFAHFDLNSCRILEKSLNLTLSVLTAEDLSRLDKRTASHFHGREIDEEAEKRERLEKEKLKLERELEEERQALKDEEIVRGLATRMLEEERVKSEHMERVLEELQLRLYSRNADELPEETEEMYPEEQRIEETIREYAHELDQLRQDSLISNEEDVWSKQDLLIISTQSI